MVQGAPPEMTGDSVQFTWGRRFGRIETSHKYMLTIVPAFFFVIISAGIALYIQMTDHIDDMAPSTHAHDPSPQLQNAVDKLIYRLDNMNLAMQDSSKVFILNSPNPINPTNVSSDWRGDKRQGKKR